MPVSVASQAVQASKLRPAAQGVAKAPTEEPNISTVQQYREGAGLPTRPRCIVPEEVAIAPSNLLRSSALPRRRENMRLRIRTCQLPEIYNGCCRSPIDRAR